MTPTIYFATLRLHGSDVELTYETDAATTRALWIIAMSAYADLIGMGER